MLFHRREALKGLGLSAGATLLAPILSQLQAQAAGKPISAEAVRVCGRKQRRSA